MALFSMDVHNLRELFIEQLRDLYDGERQIVDHLPKMIEKATHLELKTALQNHLSETERQIQRLDQIFAGIGENPKGETCKGMKGVLKEGEDLLDKTEHSGVIDAGIISSAQRVEHYEIAGYGTVRNYARLLGFEEYGRVLQQIMDEEKEADRVLTQLAESINVEARAA